jgi:hypothetical protein
VYDFRVELLLAPALAPAFPVPLRDAPVEQLLLRGGFRLTPRMRIVQDHIHLAMWDRLHHRHGLDRAMRESAGAVETSDRGQLRETKHSARPAHAAWRSWNLDKFQACRLLEETVVLFRKPSFGGTTANIAATPSLALLTPAMVHYRPHLATASACARCRLSIS